MFARASRNSVGKRSTFPGRPQKSATDRSSHFVDHENLAALGLKPGASWPEIEQAHRSLVSDLTPGPGADHGKVALALNLLAEVHAAFDALSVEQQQQDTVA